MLPKRIKYRQLNDTLQETTDVFVCNKMVCRGYYNSIKHQWYILNLVNNRVIIRNKTYSEDSAKRMIKKSLKSLGANFLDEVRSTKRNQEPVLTRELIDEILKEKEGK